MLLSPHGAMPQRLELSQANAGSDGVTVTANSTPNVMGSTWTTLIASTAFDATGLWVALQGNISSSVNASMLVDIGIGAASSEVVLAPYLMAGACAVWADGMGAMYFFPNIGIPAGSRLSARAQCATASRTINVLVGVIGGRRIPGQWIGSRITAYGVDTANSTGTPVTPGATPSWGSATQISSSTTNNIRAMQVGMDMGGDLTGANRRYLARIGVGASPGWLIENLPVGETSAEATFFGPSNTILSGMHTSIPAGSDLRFALMGSGTEARNIIIYGVD